MAALHGHPVLGWVEAMASDFGLVGETDVYAGTARDTPPDPRGSPRRRYRVSIGSADSPTIAPARRVCAFP